MARTLERRGSHGERQARSRQRQKPQGRYSERSPGGSRSRSTGGFSAENGAASFWAAAANLPGTHIKSRIKIICRILALLGRVLVGRVWRYQSWQQNPTSSGSCDAAFPAVHPEHTPLLLSYCSVTGFLQGENKFYSKANATPTGSSLTNSTFFHQPVNPQKN